MGGMVLTPVMLPRGPSTAAEGPAGSGLAGCQRADMALAAVAVCLGLPGSSPTPRREPGGGRPFQQALGGAGDRPRGQLLRICPSVQERWVPLPGHHLGRLSQGCVTWRKERPAQWQAEAAPEASSGHVTSLAVCPPPDLLRARARRLTVATWPVSLFGLATPLPSQTFARAAPGATLPPNICTPAPPL